MVLLRNKVRSKNAKMQIGTQVPGPLQSTNSGLWYSIIGTHLKNEYKVENADEKNDCPTCLLLGILKIEYFLNFLLAFVARCSSKTWILNSLVESLEAMTYVLGQYKLGVMTFISRSISVVCPPEPTTIIVLIVLSLCCLGKILTMLVEVFKTKYTNLHPKKHMATHSKWTAVINTFQMSSSPVRRFRTRSQRSETKRVW